MFPRQQASWDQGARTLGPTGAWLLDQRSLDPSDAHDQSLGHDRCPDDL